jgi:hypothetical protein
MSTWELEDIKPVKGKYTWSNKRVGSGHIAARLDRFLVQSSFLVMGLNLESTILPHSVSDHKPITLSLTTDNNLGPIPFRFNPRWIQEKSYPALVTRIWNGTVIGSPFFVWEENLRRLKKALKSWAKTLSSPIVRPPRSNKIVRSSSARNGRHGPFTGKHAARGKAAKNLAPSL